MPYIALYRECRPKIFEEVIGQEHIVKTIKNQILQNRIPHAYLFCGTRGTGKTSTAKILSRAVNCLNPNNGNPCNECDMCKGIMDGTLMDVIEIDAASNNRVENIRELIDDVKYPPHNTKYKVYIIDEVHMLSTSAFNALLKTLEEPPSYVIFILATTDPQKVPPTILSRCQRFEFKRIKTTEISMLLRKILKESGVFAEDRTLDLISRVSDGAMRDALSILDQCMSMSEGSIEYDEVSSMLGIVGREYLFELVDTMIKLDIEGGIRGIDDIILMGKDIMQFIKDLTIHFRNLLMIKVSKKPEEVIDISEDSLNKLKEQAKKLRSEEIMRGINIFVEAENAAKFTSQPRILLEMAVIKFCKREYDTSVEILANRINSLEDKLKSGELLLTNRDERDRETNNKELKITKPVEMKIQKEIIEEDTASDGKAVVPISIDEVKKSWQEVLNLIKTSKRTVSAWLSLGNPTETDENIITIMFDEQHSFSKKNLENPKENKILVEESISRVINKPAKVIFKVLEADNKIDESFEKIKQLVGEDIVEVIE